MKPLLTDRQLAMLVFIRQYLDAYRWSPSVRATCDFFGFASSNAPIRYFRTLVSKGLLLPRAPVGGSCPGYDLTPAGRALTDRQASVRLPSLTSRQLACQDRALARAVR